MSGSIGVEPRERLVPCSRSAAGDFFISGEHLFPWHRQIRKVKRLSRRTCRHKVQYYETDQMGIVHHSNYIRWFEEARTWLMDPRAPHVDPPAHILKLREQGVNRRV